MDTDLIKFFILWIICENIMLTTSMSMKGMTKEDANIREKRSPASLFGFNLGSPVSAAKETFSSIGNIFSGNRGNRHHNNYHEPIDIGGPYGNVRNTNTFPPIDFPSRSGISNTMTHNDFQNGDRYTWPQENKSEVVRKTVPERNNQVLNQQQQPPENTRNYQSNADVDKQLLEYIFQNQKFNNDPAGTTVDNNIYFVTEPGEFETTTYDINNRILPPAAVATLLG